MALLGVAFAFAIGSVWGGLSGRFGWFAAFTQPLLSTLMALPPLILVVLGIVWLGPSCAVTRMVVTLVALPLIVIMAIESLIVKPTTACRLRRRTVAADPGGPWAGL